MSVTQLVTHVGPINEYSGELEFKSPTRHVFGDGVKSFWCD